MVSCPENDWTCPYFDSEGGGKCRLPPNAHLRCEFLSPPLVTPAGRDALDAVIESFERVGFINRNSSIVCH